MASNIVHLPARSASPVNAASRRKPRNRTGRVLAFTGAKRYVYDREAVLRDHKQEMCHAAYETLKGLEAGNYTGLMIVATSAYWQGRGDEESSITTWSLGILQEDPSFRKVVVEHVSGLLDADGAAARDGA